MEFTEAQISNWKKLNPEGIHEIEVIIDEERQEVATCILKQPTLDIILAAGELHDSPVKQGIMILENIWIEGDEVIKTNEEAKAAVAIIAAGLFKVKVATAKKL